MPRPPTVEGFANSVTSTALAAARAFATAERWCRTPYPSGAIVPAAPTQLAGDRIARRSNRRREQRFNCDSKFVRRFRQS